MGRAKVGRRADHYVTSWGEPIVGLHRRGDGRWYPIAKPNHVYTEPDERHAIHKLRLWEAEQKKGGPLSSDEAMQLNLRKLEAWQRWVETHPEAAEQIHTDIEAAVVGERLRIIELIKTNPKQAAAELDYEPLERLLFIERPKPSITLADIGKLYDAAKKDEIEPVDLTKFNKYWDEFAAFVKVRTVDLLDFDLFDAYAKKVKADQLKPSKKTGKPRKNTFTRARFLTVKTYINFAYESRKIDAQLWNRLRQDWKQPLKAPPAPRGAPKPLTPEEFQAIFNKAETDLDRCLLLIGLNAALTPIDIKRVLWDHVDDHHLVFTRVKKDVHDKQGTLRVAYLWDRTVRALKKLREGSDSPHIFVSREGNPLSISASNDHFVALRDAAGVTRPLTFKHLKKSAATVASKNGTVTQYRVLLGHSISAEDEAYILSNPDYVKEPCHAIERHYFGSEQPTQPPRRSPSPKMKGSCGYRVRGGRLRCERSRAP